MSFEMHNQPCYLYMSVFDVCEIYKSTAKEKNNSFFYRNC